MVALQLGSAFQVGHITACRRLGDCQTTHLLTLHTWRHHTLLQLFAAVVVDRWQANRGTTSDAPLKANRAGARHLVVHDQLMEIVRLEAPRVLAVVFLWPRPSNAQRKGALLASLQVHLLGDDALPGL